jgi:hypothetical protein
VFHHAPLICSASAVSKSLRAWLLVVLLLLGETGSLAAEQKVPPAGVAITPEVRARLEKSAAELRQSIDSTAAELRGRPELLPLLPDVEIFHKAVCWALRYDEFLDLDDARLRRS